MLLCANGKMENVCFKVVEIRKGQQNENSRFLYQMPGLVAKEDYWRKIPVVPFFFFC